MCGLDGARVVSVAFSRAQIRFLRQDPEIPESWIPPKGFPLGLMEFANAVRNSKIIVNAPIYRFLFVRFLFSVKHFRYKEQKK